MSIIKESVTVSISDLLLDTSLESEDWELPVCGLNPNDPEFAGCESCQ